MTEPKVAFRFRNLNKMQAFTLTKEVPGARYRALADVGVYEGVVALTEHILDELTIFFVRQQISLQECDVHIEAVDTSCTEVATPLIVNKLLKHIDCQLTFSITNLE